MRFVDVHQIALIDGRIHFVMEFEQTDNVRLEIPGTVYIKFRLCQRCKTFLVKLAMLNLLLLKTIAVFGHDSRRSTALPVAVPVAYP
jgi:hypothetical protein